MLRCGIDHTRRRGRGRTSVARCRTGETTPWTHIRRLIRLLSAQTSVTNKLLLLAALALMVVASDAAAKKDDSTVKPSPSPKAPMPSPSSKAPNPSPKAKAPKAKKAPKIKSRSLKIDAKNNSLKITAKSAVNPECKKCKVAAQSSYYVVQGRVGRRREGHLQPFAEQDQVRPRHRRVAVRGQSGPAEHDLSRDVGRPGRPAEVQGQGEVR